MAKFTIEKKPCTRAMDTMKISGFADGELAMLKRLSNADAREKLLDMIDKRNNGIATCWHNGAGVFGVWFDNEFAYINVGTSCD